MVYHVKHIDMKKVFCRICGCDIKSKTRLIEVKDGPDGWLAACIDCWRRPDFYDRIEALKPHVYGTRTDRNQEAAR